MFIDSDDWMKLSHGCSDVHRPPQPNNPAPGSPLTARVPWQPAAMVVVCLALLNALRRTVFRIANDTEFTILQFLQVFATGILVGSAMLIAMIWATRHSAPAGWRQFAWIAACTGATSVIAVLAKDAWEFWTVAGLSGEFTLTDYVFRDWVRYGLLGALLAVAYGYFRIETDSDALAHECTADSARMEAQLAETRLRLLEAQIEPHFLFNSLAGLKRLLQSDAAAAGRLLDNLSRYFSTALPHMRSAQSTLGGEAALADAYLLIHKTRMGRRLAFTVDVPSSLRGASIPPFMVLTLVENAIKHGVAQLVEGGTVAVRARTAQGRLIVEVQDTGAGFTGLSGVGTGLANIRARLQLLHGSDASLALGSGEPRGVIARLDLPLQMTAAG